MEEGGTHSIEVGNVEGDYEITAIVNDADDHIDEVPGPDEPSNEVERLVPGILRNGVLGVRSDVTYLRSTRCPASGTSCR